MGGWLWLFLVLLAFRRPARPHPRTMLDADGDPIEPVPIDTAGCAPLVLFAMFLGLIVSLILEAGEAMLTWFR